MRKVTSQLMRAFLSTSLPKQAGTETRAQLLLNVGHQFRISCPSVCLPACLPVRVCVCMYVHVCVCTCMNNYNAQQLAISYHWCICLGCVLSTVCVSIETIIAVVMSPEAPMRYFQVTVHLVFCDCRICCWRTM